MYRYILDRGMTTISEGGFQTPEEAEWEGRQQARELNAVGLDTVFVKVEEEE